MLLLLVSLACALYMTGLIWFVQVVHYPLFAGVGAGEFARYHALHSSRTTGVVLLPMAIELLTAALLVAQRPAGAPGWAVWLSLALAVATWAVTALVSVPLHGRLDQGAVAPGEAIAALVGTNWLRTVAWSARSGLLLWLTYTVFGSPT